MPEAAPKEVDALFADRPQQPLDVVAGCTQHGMVIALPVWPLR